MNKYEKIAAKRAEKQTERRSLMDRIKKNMGDSKSPVKPSSEPKAEAPAKRKYTRKPKAEPVKPSYTRPAKKVSSGFARRAALRSAGSSILNRKKETKSTHTASNAAPTKSKSSIRDRIVPALKTVGKAAGNLAARGGKAVAKGVGVAAKVAGKLAARGGKAGGKLAWKGTKAGSKLAYKGAKAGGKLAGKLVVKGAKELHRRYQQGKISENFALNELSAKTMKNYVIKALSDKTTEDFMNGWKVGRNNTDDYSSPKSMKRRKGIVSAITLANRKGI